MDLHLGVLPEMDREAPERLTASKRIIQNFASEKKVDTMFIKDLIQKVLHHPDFDQDDVDHDMLEQQMTAIEEGCLEVIDLKEQGDSNQDVRLFQQPVLTCYITRQIISQEGVKQLYDILNNILVNIIKVYLTY